jgi:hypothetical protein
MILYLYGDTQEKIDKLAKIAVEKGHVIVGTTFSTGFAEELVAVCDTLVIGIGGEAVFLTQDICRFAKTIGLPVSWDAVPEMHVTEVKNPKQAKAFRLLIGQMYRTHLRKNADYSSANILGTGEIGLVTRLWDKMARIMNLEGFTLNIASMSYGQPKEAKNEPIADTFMDMAVYAVIALLYRAGKWGR